MEREQRLQRRLALRTHQEQQNRLDDIAYPILRAAVPLCDDDVAPRAGFRFANAHVYEGVWRDAARTLGLGDTVQVTGVARGSAAERAGLRPGDRLLRVAGRAVPVGSGAVEAIGRILNNAVERQDTALVVGYRRDGAEHEAMIHLEPACAYNAHVMIDGALNAYADGSNIVVTSTMMRFADDDELAVIVAHELAHNAMDHIDAKRSNAILGAVLGAIGDVALAASGVNTGGAYARQGAQAGAQAYSQDFEREADYVGLYAMALAGLPLADAPTFWRHMAQADPSSIGLAYSHPTTAERFVRMREMIAEIRRKQIAGEPLRPELKAGTGR